MHLIIIYLIKAAIFQALLLACYWLLLRRDTFYKMNRFYFIGGLILSLIVPLVNFDISSWFRHKEAVQPVFVYQYIPDLSFQTLQPWWQQFSFGDYALMFFIAGSVIMLIRLLLQYLSIKKLETRTKACFEEYNIQLLDDAVNPFSFGKTIYLNPHLHSEQELEEIIEHELIHIIQRHSIDIILASVNRCIFWWNPAAWVLNKVIRDNLEFIADKSILEKGFDRKHYQYHLLRISQLAYPNTVAQHFNFSNLKKRITMMNKKETNRYQKMKWLLLVPVAAIILLSFNYRENLQQQIKIITGVETDTIPPLPRTPYPVKLNSKGNYVDIRNYNGECIVVVESNKQEPIARIPLTKWDADQKNYVAKYGEIPPLPKPPAPPAPKTAKAPRAPLAPSPALPDDVATINIRNEKNYSKNKNSNANIATVTLNNGKQENYNLDNKEEKAKYEKKYGGVPAPPPPPPPVAQPPISAVAMPDNVLVIVDGVEKTKAEINNIPAAKIQSVQVLKDEHATKEYGEKGKNGVIKIITKPETTVDVRAVTAPTKVTAEVDPAFKIRPVTNDVEVIGYKINPAQSNVLYIVDGVITNAAEFNSNIKPEDITSINVLKGTSATSLYGDKGKDGVIVVSTKQKSTEVSPMKSKEPK